MSQLEPCTSVSAFRVVRLLAAGPGAGTVYEASEGDLDRPVALKVFAGRLSESPDFRQLFRREAPKLARLAHPHITRTYEAGASEHGLYLALRLVDGPSLRELIEPKGMDPYSVVRLLAPVAEALDLAHESGVLHRDLKPAKILIGASGRSALTGFGFSRPRRSGRRARPRVRGAVAYMSPEQARGEVAGRRSEVYSLAAIAYEAFAGVAPFEADSDEAILSAHVLEPPPALSARRPELPGELDEILARGLAKDPAERPRSATGLLDGLGKALEAARGSDPLVRSEPENEARPYPQSPARPSAREGRPLHNGAAAAARRRPLHGSSNGEAPRRPRVGRGPEAAGERSASAGAVRWRESPAPSAPTPQATARSSAATAPPKREEGREVARPVQQPRGPMSASRMVAARGRRRASGSRRQAAAVALAGLMVAAGAAGWYLPAELGLTPRQRPAVSAAASRAASGDDAYAMSLSRALERINQRRPEADRRLSRARAAGGQARAARALAAVHRTAAATVASGSRTGRERRASAPILAALGDVERSYGRMASSATRGDARGFELAGRAARRGEARVRRAVDRLDALGP